MTNPIRPQTPADANIKGQTSFKSGMNRAFAPVYTFGSPKSSATTAEVAPKSKNMWTPRGHLIDERNY